MTALSFYVDMLDSSQLEEEQHAIYARWHYARLQCSGMFSMCSGLMKIAVQYDLHTSGHDSFYNVEIRRGLLRFG